MMNNRYVILQCSAEECRFRCPAPIDDYSVFCPLCGEKFKVKEVECNNGYTHFHDKKSKTKQIACLLDNIRSAYNVGSIFRSAEVFQIDHIFICGYSPIPTLEKVQKTSLGAEENVSWSFHRNALDVVKEKLSEDYSVLCIEAAKNAIPLASRNQRNFNKDVLLIFGNEKYGVDPLIRDLSSSILQIPMLGTKESLNVSTAFAIAAYHFSVED